MENVSYLHPLDKSIGYFVPDVVHGSAASPAVALRGSVLLHALDIAVEYLEGSDGIGVQRRGGRDRGQRASLCDARRTRYVCNATARKSEHHQRLEIRPRTCGRYARDGRWLIAGCWRPKSERRFDVSGQRPPCDTGLDVRWTRRVALADSADAFFSSVGSHRCSRHTTTLPFFTFLSADP